MFAKIVFKTNTCAEDLAAIETAFQLVFDDGLQSNVNGHGVFCNAKKEIAFRLLNCLHAAQKVLITIRI